MMTRLETWLSHISTLVVGVSGIIYLWMKYLMQTNDPFALVNHPLQPAMLNIHILAAPVLTFVFGLIVSSHARKKLSSPARSNRRSGVVTLVTFPVMVISGYGLQVAMNETLTTTMLVLHIASSAAFSLIYVVHLLVSIRLGRAVGVAAKNGGFARRQTA